MTSWGPIDTPAPIPLGRSALFRERRAGTEATEVSLIYNVP